jgi:hypothetical protein
MWLEIYKRSQHRMNAPTKRRFCTARAVMLFLLSVGLTSMAALMAQSMSPAAQKPTPQGSAALSGPAINESLRPALAQAGSALSQVRIDHWKLSRESKEQLRGDADSIQRDLTTQLPGLFQAAQQSPTALEPQLNIMHNVDALYDVLVRIATTANLAGGKADIDILDNAVLRLESARKAAASQVLQAASLQDQEIVKLRTSLQATQDSETTAGGHTHTIIVNDRISHRTGHSRTTTHRKAVPKGNPPSTAPSTSNSHTTTP